MDDRQAVMTMAGLLIIAAVEGTDEDMKAAGECGGVGGMRYLAGRYGDRVADVVAGMNEGVAGEPTRVAVSDIEPYGPCEMCQGCVLWGGSRGCQSTGTATSFYVVGDRTVCSKHTTAGAQR